MSLNPCRGSDQCRSFVVASSKPSGCSSPRAPSPSHKSATAQDWNMYENLRGGRLPGIRAAPRLDARLAPKRSAHRIALAASLVRQRPVQAHRADGYRLHGGRRCHALHRSSRAIPEPRGGLDHLLEFRQHHERRVARHAAHDPRRERTGDPDRSHAGARRHVRHLHQLPAHLHPDRGSGAGRHPDDRHRLRARGRQPGAGHPEQQPVPQRCERDRRGEPARLRADQGRHQHRADAGEHGRRLRLHQAAALSGDPRRVVAGARLRGVRQQPCGLRRDRAGGYRRHHHVSLERAGTRGRRHPRRDPDRSAHCAAGHRSHLLPARPGAGDLHVHARRSLKSSPAQGRREFRRVGQDVLQHQRDVSQRLRLSLRRRWRFRRLPLDRRVPVALRLRHSAHGAHRLRLPRRWIQGLAARHPDGGHHPRAAGQRPLVGHHRGRSRPRRRRPARKRRYPDGGEPLHGRHHGLGRHARRVAGCQPGSAIRGPDPRRRNAARGCELHDAPGHLDHRQQRCHRHEGQHRHPVGLVERAGRPHQERRGNSGAHRQRPARGRHRDRRRDPVRGRRRDPRYARRDASGTTASWRSTGPTTSCSTEPSREAARWP